MAKGYSVFSLLRHALKPDTPWGLAWEKPTPKSSYDVIIIGGGGHGLATAYYLAKNHGITNVAVLEKGYIGSGNVGRNTTIMRSNYMIDGNTPVLRALAEAVGRPVARPELQLHGLAARAGGAGGEFPASWTCWPGAATSCASTASTPNCWTAARCRSCCPISTIRRRRASPSGAASIQPRAGTVRHDAVAWGYARAASQLGVHIIENCEVTGIHHGRQGPCRGRRDHARAHQCRQGRDRGGGPHLGVAAWPA
jgi:glycine/D-amino acid oxidase-like deaminating enzyme